ncbi:MAG: formyltransferase family protein [Saprospiraceae bacterium]
MNFIILTNSGENNYFVKEVLESNLLPKLICSDSPFHFKSSNLIKHGLKLIFQHFLYWANRNKYHKKYQAYFLSRKHNIPFFPSYMVNSNDFKHKIKPLHIDFGFVFTFQILSKNILSLPNKGFINFHPSKLPHNRGATPHQWVIYSGEKTTGITFHFLDEGIDTGAIIEQYEVPLSGYETADILYNHLLALGSRLMIQLIHRLNQNPHQIRPVKSIVTLGLEPIFIAENFEINDRMSFEEINSLVRACRINQSYAKCSIKNKSFFVTSCIKLDNYQIQNVENQSNNNQCTFITSDNQAVLLVFKKQM